MWVALSHWVSGPLLQQQMDSGTNLNTKQPEHEAHAACYAAMKFFVSDPGALCLLPASTELCHDTCKAWKRAQILDPSQFLTFSQ